MKLETIAIHAGNEIDPHTRAIIQPITLSTTFEKGPDGGYPGGYMYTRAGNPNRKSLENVLAKLEGGADACAFASGNAAGSAVFQALAPGSHAIVPTDMYHGLKTLLNEVYQGIIDIEYADMANLTAVEGAIRPETRLIWVETPSNPLLKVTDIAAVCQLAAGRDILVCCDNTFATPVFQRPLELGADIVMHSSTKYFGGHSDVLGGALITGEDTSFWERIRNVQLLAGSSPSPFDCYLTVRGIKTLPYRMKGHASNALALAQYLQSHPAVEKVYYPGLKDHHMHEVAASQMSGFGGMLSFLLKGGQEKALRVVSKTRIFSQATSLGGVESLIEHRASAEGPNTTTPFNLVRVSVGIENIDDLIADLSQALEE